MAHSKMTKKGKSYYVDKWNPSAKAFIDTCSLCGAQGYNPSIDEEGFVHPAPDKTDFVHRAIRAELTEILSPLPLDRLGRCAQCAKLMDKN